MENYTKTILSSYPSIESVITQIENLIRNKARNSFYVYQNTQKIAEQILALGEIAKDLFILKEIVEETLLSLSVEDRELISFKYFGILPEREDFDHTSRNYFRKQVRALKRFCDALIKRGYNEDWFKTKYLKIAFISGVYQKTLLEQGKKHVR